MHGEAIERLLEVMAVLRDPERGCPWDRAQTFASIVPHTLEEAYEVAEAIERENWDELAEELGDLLFQVVFYARLAEEAGLFAFHDVVAAIIDKLVRRHPHVFGGARVEDAAAQSEAWEAHKARERQARAGGAPASALDGVGRALPALSRAAKLQRRAARVGFDWAGIEPVRAKVEEELRELEAAMVSAGRTDASPAPAVEEEVGDLLFACVNLARHAGVEPETALRRTNAKFERRFREIERHLRAEGRRPEETSLAELDRLWERVKAQERAP